MAFHLRGVVTHHHLIHGDDQVQHGNTVMVDHSDEFRIELLMLLLLAVSEKFMDPSCGLLFKAQILMKNGVNGENELPMGSSQSLDAQPVVFP